MEPYFETEHGKLYLGDALKILRQLPDNSVDTVITSPPYWAKRNYGISANKIWGGDPNCDHEWVKLDSKLVKLYDDGNGDRKNKKINAEKVEPCMFCRKCGAWYGQLGLEPDPLLFVEHLAEIFDEVKRILKPTGNLFVNIDDTWVRRSVWWDDDERNNRENEGKRTWLNHVNEAHQEPPTLVFRGIKRKSLALVPELFAVKMVYEHGWILREKIIWSKKVHLYKERTTKGNAMPEAVKDRFSHSWEYIFHFTKRPKYYFNLDTVRVPLKAETIARSFRNTTSGKLDGTHRGITVKSKNNYIQKIRSKYLETTTPTRSPGGRLAKILASGDEEKKILVKKAIDDVNAYLKRKLKESNLTVKELSKIIGIKESTLAHYFRTDLSGAAIPPKTVWKRLQPILGLDDYKNHVKEEYRSVLPSPHELGANPGDVVQINLRPFKGAHFAVFPPDLPELLVKASCPEKGVVLDPFAGAGTTLIVAEKHGCNWIGIEINKEYCELIKNRFEKETTQRKL